MAWVSVKASNKGSHGEARRPEEGIVHDHEHSINKRPRTHHSLLGLCAALWC